MNCATVTNTQRRAVTLQLSEKLFHFLENENGHRERILQNCYWLSIAPCYTREAVVYDIVRSLRRTRCRRWMVMERIRSVVVGHVVITFPILAEMGNRRNCCSWL